MCYCYRRSSFVRCCMIALMSLLSACAVIKPSIMVPKQLPKVVAPKKPVRVALVLGAGGARGYAHLGVLQVLSQAGVPIDFIAGASVGSVVGALYADQGSWRKTYHVMMSAGFWNFADISAIPHLSGLMTGYHLQSFLKRHLTHQHFNQLRIPLAVVTTNLASGKAFVIQSGPVIPAAAASSTIPGVVQPAHLYGHTLVDGGVVDPVPVDIAKRYHPQLIIAVDIDKSFGLPIPKLALKILLRSTAIMGHHLALASANGADVLIMPHLGDVGTFDIADKYQLYKAGFSAAKKALPKILRLMKQRHIPRVRHS